MSDAVIPRKPLLGDGILAQALRGILDSKAATLAAIAELKPTSVAQLARVNGVGPAKIDRYGETILAIVADSIG